jgi:hypothetical protein
MRTITIQTVCPHGLVKYPGCTLGWLATQPQDAIIREFTSAHRAETQCDCHPTVEAR